MSDKILKVIDLHKRYPTGRSAWLPVLKGIDFEVEEGQIIAIVGPSGVGKSTLLHLIGALDRPNQGGVEIDGENIFRFDFNKLASYRNKTIGFVFQFHHLLPEFSALENIIMPAMIGGEERTAFMQRGHELLSLVGLAQRAHHRPRELSGGEQQRVAVARALVNHPRLLLADEPSGNLDMQSAESLHDLLWQLSRELKQTLIVVTHNRDLAERSDRVVELYDGKILRNRKPQR
ncbi:ABC transporter ATP-binding protein [candidate division KSB1 bacterium]|nr:ABC transporter ATP-binding protein [candidate division KSB1 bacterium]